jgi:hypothetical protein
MTGLGERRSRGSGGVDFKPCPGCRRLVRIDPRVMARDRQGFFQVCVDCLARVPVRQSDASRRVPADAPPPESPPHHGLFRRRFRGPARGA